MKIGIDIDEVVADFIPAFLEFYNSNTGRNVSFNDFTSYNFWEVLGGTRDDAIRLVNEFYDSSFFENVGLIENSLESVKSLSENNELFFITSRPDWIKDKTEDFLRRHLGNISFEIVFSGDFFGGGKSKAEICKDLEVDFLVEDNKKYSSECAGLGVCVFLIDKPWNQGEDLHKNISRVNGWSEIMNLIKNLQRKKENEH